MDLGQSTESGSSTTKTPFSFSHIFGTEQSPPPQGFHDGLITNARRISTKPSWDHMNPRRSFSTTATLENDDDDHAQNDQDFEISTTTISATSSTKRASTKSSSRTPTADESTTTTPPEPTPTKSRKKSTTATPKAPRKSAKQRAEIDEFGGLTAPLPTLISHDTGEQFDFFVDLDEDISPTHTLPEAALPIEHYHGIIPTLPADGTDADVDADIRGYATTRSSTPTTTTPSPLRNAFSDPNDLLELDLNSFNESVGLNGGGGRIGKSTTSPKSFTTPSPATRTIIYKDHESSQDSIVNIPKKRKTSSNDDIGETTTATKSSKRKVNNNLTTGIILDSVAPSTLAQLPISIVVHAILSNIDAGVNNIGNDAGGKKKNKPSNDPSQVTNDKHPGCTVVRGLFSTIVIGQEKPSHSSPTGK
jgi:hypothetical protein